MKQPDTLAIMLLAGALALALGRVLAVPFKRFGQPVVLAQIFAGIVLGPAILGGIWPAATDTLFTPEVRAALSAVGTVGLVLFMFLIGLEFNPKVLRRHDRLLAKVSAGALLLPFVMGLGVAAILLSSHPIAPDVTTLGFVLFVATALSITAFPVLACIIDDRRIGELHVSQLALGSAAAQDIGGWMLVTIALTAAAGGGADGPLRIVLELVAFIVVLIWVVRPLLAYVLARLDKDDAPQHALAIVLVALLTCAGTTELMGLHAVIGAFALGVAIPRQAMTDLVPRLDATIRPLTLTVLLPISFLMPGLTFSLEGLGAERIGEVLLVLFVACFGKIVGGGVAGRLGGMTKRDSRALGVMLNTRGLMELVVLQVGFQAGIINREVFSVLLVMALVTTLMTNPLLNRLGIVAPPEEESDKRAEAQLPPAKERETALVE